MSKHRFELLEKEKTTLEHKANNALQLVEEFKAQISEEDDVFAAFEVKLGNLPRVDLRQIFFGS
jgi:hypothetical protein